MRNSSVRNPKIPERNMSTSVLFSESRSIAADFLVIDLSHSWVSKERCQIPRALFKTYLKHRRVFQIARVLALIIHWMISIPRRPISPVPSNRNGEWQENVALICYDTIVQKSINNCHNNDNKFKKYFVRFENKTKKGKI